MSYNLTMSELIEIIRNQTPPTPAPTDYSSTKLFLQGYMTTYFPSTSPKKINIPIDEYLYIEKRI